MNNEVDNIQYMQECIKILGSSQLRSKDFYRLSHMKLLLIHLNNTIASKTSNDRVVTNKRQTNNYNIAKALNKQETSRVITANIQTDNNIYYDRCA